MKGWLVIRVLVGALMTACSAGSSDDSDPFGNPTFSPTTPAPGDDDDGSGGSESGSSAGGNEESGFGTTAGVDGSTSAAPPPASTGAADDGSSGIGPADSGGGDAGQPADGMYSPCLTAPECMPLNVCITVLDMDMNPVEGFYTNSGCANPAVDCQPSPGGTAVPFCMSVELDGNPDMACALDCAGGLTCPGGMMCWNLGSMSICA